MVLLFLSAMLISARFFLSPFVLDLELVNFVLGVYLILVFHILMQSNSEIELLSQRRS